MILRFLLPLVLVIAPWLRGEPYAEELPPGLRARLNALAQPLALVADFTESRQTRLKKKPLIVSGVVRIHRDRGLSLDYDQARSPIVILDSGGLLLRHPDGREQHAPPEAEHDLRLLHALFCFDLVTLEKTYSLSAAETPDASWNLVFTRRPESEATYLELSLIGHAGSIATIVLRKAPSQSTTITLSPPNLDVTFTPEELARYFR